MKLVLFSCIVPLAFSQNTNSSVKTTCTLCPSASPVGQSNKTLDFYGAGTQTCGLLDSYLNSIVGQTACNQEKQRIFTENPFDFISWCGCQGSNNNQTAHPCGNLCSGKGSIVLPNDYNKKVVLYNNQSYSCQQLDGFVPYITNSTICTAGAAVAANTCCFGQAPVPTPATVRPAPAPTVNIQPTILRNKVSGSYRTGGAVVDTIVSGVVVTLVALFLM
jgi:hypothetical protein